MKRLFFIACAMLICFASNAQTNAKSENGLLWRISGKGVKEPSYLFGTAHIICKTDYVWTDDMMKALKSCDELCLEMNIDDQKEMQKVMAGMADPTGKKLNEYFTKEQYAALQTFFSDSVHVPLAMFEALKPTALLGVIENYAANCGAAAESYEMNLIKQAKENKQKIGGFETAEEMLELLDKIPGDSVVSSVIAMTKDFSENRAYNKKIITYYKDQNIEGIYDVVHSSGALGGNEAFLVNNRNKNWVKAMQSKMPENPVFYAVGAGHLGGPEGLIALLKQKGYTVEKVK